MIHPDTQIRFINDVIGVGVFATRLIRKGTIVWIQDELDMELSREYVRSLDPLRREMIVKYAYIGARGQYVLCWDHGRYVNHAFYPNMAVTAYGFELAAQDILPGEELRCDYATFGSEASFACAPEAGTLRTRVTPDDYLYAHRSWDEAAREAFKHFNLVDQPLRYLIRPELVDKVSAVAAGQAPLDPILTLYAPR